MFLNIFCAIVKFFGNLGAADVSRFLFLGGDYLDVCLLGMWYGLCSHSVRRDLFPVTVSSAFS
jgi:hypothetical protein